MKEEKVRAAAAPSVLVHKEEGLSRLSGGSENFAQEENKERNTKLSPEKLILKQSMGSSSLRMLLVGEAIKGLKRMPGWFCYYNGGI